MMGLLPLLEAIGASVAITIVILLGIDKCEREDRDDESADKTSER